jgi:hypothetical protein
MNTPTGPQAQEAGAVSACRLCAAHEARNPESKVCFCSNRRCCYYTKPARKLK